MIQPRALPWFERTTLLGNENFRQAALTSDVVHASGDGNIAADALSRSSTQIFHALMQALRVRPHKVSVPSGCHTLLKQLVNEARRSGAQVKQGCRVIAQPRLPRSLCSAFQSIPKLDVQLPSSSTTFLSQEVIEHEPSLAQYLRDQRRSSSSPRSATTPTISQMSSRVDNVSHDHPSIQQTPRQQMPSASVGGVWLAQRQDFSARNHCQMSVARSD